MPNLSILKNPLDDTFSFAGAFGGRSTDYYHPIPEHRRNMMVTKQAKEQLESNVHQKIQVPRDKAL